jgi:hypothetical protein
MDHTRKEIDIPLWNALAVEVSKCFKESSVGEGDKTTSPASGSGKRNANGRVHNGLAYINVGG